jgi:hypothetical protein
MKRIVLSLVVSLSLTTPLSSCVERVLPTSVGTNQQSAQTASLKLQMVFQDPANPDKAASDLLKNLQKIKIEISENKSNLKSDEITLDDSSKAAADLTRTIEKVSVGALEIKLSFLDKDGKELQTSLTQNLKTIANAESSLKIALYGNSVEILAAVAPSPVKVLSTLWQEQLSLQNELQSLYQKQNTLLVQARTLLRSTAPEDRIQLEQLRSELNTISLQIDPKESRIKAIETELKGLESQSTAQDMVKLLLLLQQAENQRKDLDILLQRRSLVFSQSKTLLGQSGNTAQEQLSQSQAELQSINSDLSAKQGELEKTIAELEKLQVQVVAANASELKPEDLKAQLEILTPSIAQLETHEQELKQQIAALIEKTDLRNVNRREGFEAELKQLQARLDELRSQRDALQKRLDAAQPKS